MTIDSWLEELGFVREEILPDMIIYRKDDLYIRFDVMNGIPCLYHWTDKDTQDDEESLQ